MTCEEVVADVSAGRLLEHTLTDGQCAHIAIGAVVPDGADAAPKVERSVVAQVIPMMVAAWIRRAEPGAS